MMSDTPTTPITKSLVHTDVVEELPIIKEATTSRVVVNNDVLRYVLFSFDKGQLLTEHTSTRAVIVQVLDGAIDFTVDGKESRLGPGDFVYLAPNDPHSLVAAEPSHMALTLVAVD